MAIVEYFKKKIMWILSLPTPLGEDIFEGGCDPRIANFIAMH